MDIRTTCYTGDIPNEFFNVQDAKSIWTHRLGLVRSGLLVTTACAAALAAGCQTPRGADAEPRAPVPLASPVTDSTGTRLAPFEIEYYYKARWGHAAEFLELFKRNYLPQLEEMRRQGRIIDFVGHVPRHHASEDSRWDFRLQITWRDVVTAHDDHHPEELIARLFPDRERHRAEERRRFEILIAHWDVLVEQEELVVPTQR